MKADEMKATLSRWEKSGLSLRAFGEREGISYSKLTYWKRRLGRSGGDPNGVDLTVMSAFGGNSSLSVSPYARWESVDTQAEVPSGFSSNATNDVDVLTLGINIKPIDQVVIKLDFQDFDDGADRFNLSLGFIF